MFPSAYGLENWVIFGIWLPLFELLYRFFFFAWVKALRFSSHPCLADHIKHSSQLEQTGTQQSRLGFLDLESEDPTFFWIFFWNFRNGYWSMCTGVWPCAHTFQLWKDLAKIWKFFENFRNEKWRPVHRFLAMCTHYSALESEDLANFWNIFEMFSIGK